MMNIRDPRMDLHRTYSYTISPMVRASVPTPPALLSHSQGHGGAVAGSSPHTARSLRSSSFSSGKSYSTRARGKHSAPFRWTRSQNQTIYDIRGVSKQYRQGKLIGMLIGHNLTSLMLFLDSHKLLRLLAEAGVHTILQITDISCG